jgi:hypothetical protein
LIIITRIRIVDCSSSGWKMIEEGKIALRLVLFFALSTLTAIVCYFFMMVVTCCCFFVPSLRIIRFRRNWCDWWFSLFGDALAVLIEMILLKDTKIRWIFVDQNQNQKPDFTFDRFLKTPKIITASTHTAFPSNSLSSPNSLKKKQKWGWIIGGFLYGRLLGHNGGLRLIVKERLRGIPVFGWAMQILHFVFINKDSRSNRESNVHCIKQTLNYLILTGTGRHSLSMLLFPQSLRIARSLSQERLDELANQNQNQQDGSDLIIRPSGFNACVEKMRMYQQQAQKQEVGIHDLSIYIHGNEDENRNGCGNGILGWIPQNITVYVRWNALNTLPQDNSELEQWLRTQFKEKRNILNNEAVNSSSRTTYVPLRELFETNDLTLNSSEDPNQNQKRNPNPYRLGRSRSYIFLTITCAGSILTLSMLWSIWVRYLFVAFIMTSIAARAVGGIDSAELALYSDLVTKSFKKSE